MPTTNIQWCHARRHIPAFAFLVYDAMLAMAKSDKKREPGTSLQCFAYQKTIANHCNVSERAVRRAVKWLVENGWLRPMSQLGSTGANRYAILEHAEYLTRFPDTCLPLRYDPETGEDVGSSGEMSLAFLIHQLHRLAGSVFRYDFGWSDDSKAWLRKSEYQPDADARLKEGQPDADARLSNGHGR